MAEHGQQALRHQSDQCVIIQLAVQNKDCCKLLMNGCGEERQPTITILLERP